MDDMDNINIDGIMKYLEFYIVDFQVMGLYLTNPFFDYVDIFETYFKFLPKDIINYIKRMTINLKQFLNVNSLKKYLDKSHNDRKLRLFIDYLYYPFYHGMFEFVLRIENEYYYSEYFNFSNKVYNFIQYIQKNYYPKYANYIYYSSWIPGKILQKINKIEVNRKYINFSVINLIIIEFYQTTPDYSIGKYNINWINNFNNRLKK